MRFNRKVVAGASLVLATAAALTACSSGGGSTPASSAAAAASGPAVSLKGVCPADVVVQTDWDPEADHGHLYQLLGPGYTVDTQKKSATGPLYANGKATGVNITIKLGGKSINYASVSQQMYTDKSIYMGYVSTDEAVEFSQKFPTTAVFAETNISPQMIMWDPSVYPTVTDIKSLGVAVAAESAKENKSYTIRYFSGAAYMSYLTGSGILSKSVVNGAYDGTPAKFVGDQGKSGQQGFATAEPYIYQHEIPAFNKAVKFQLINDTGYPIYPEAMSVRTADLSSDSACLKKLVPVMQQADVDYFKSPTATNDVVTALVTKYNDGWVYDNAVANYATAEMKKLKLIGNGADGYVGEFDSTRFQKIIDIDTPIFTATGTIPKSGLTPADLFTNQFLSKTVKF